MVYGDKTRFLTALLIAITIRRAHSRRIGGKLEKRTPSALTVGLIVLLAVPRLISVNQLLSMQTEMTIPQQIEDALDAIRPALHIDGGDVEFVGFSDVDGVVQIRLTGACGGCPISSVTVKHGIERRIRAAVPQVTEVAVV